MGLRKWIGEHVIMGQAGQANQGGGFVERVEAVAQRIVNTHPESVLGTAVPAAPPAPAPVPDVAGKDVAAQAATPVPAAPVQATPVVTSEPTDVDLLRDQLEGAVVNSRERVDAIEARLVTVEAQSATHQATIEALVSALEAIK